MTQLDDSKNTGNELDEILEELYRAGTHKMYCTEPHHFRSIAETERQIQALIEQQVLIGRIDQQFKAIQLMDTKVDYSDIYFAMHKEHDRLATLKAQLKEGK